MAAGISGVRVPGPPKGLGFRVLGGFGPLFYLLWWGFR